MFLCHCFLNSARCHANTLTDKPEQYLSIHSKAYEELTKLKDLFTIQQLLGANQYSWLRAQTFTSAAAAPFGEHVPVSLWVFLFIAKAQVMIRWHVKNFKQLLDKTCFFKLNKNPPNKYSSCRLLGIGC